MNLSALQQDVVEADVRRLSPADQRKVRIGLLLLALVFIGGSIALAVWVDWRIAAAIFLAQWGQNAIDFARRLRLTITIANNDRAIRDMVMRDRDAASRSTTGNKFGAGLH